MNHLNKLLAGWTFRTAAPTFESGEVIAAYVNERNNGGLTIRIGGSVIWVENDGSTAVEDKVRPEVTPLDTSNHIDTGDMIEVLGPDV